MSLSGGRDPTPKDEISNYPFVNGDKFKESGVSLDAILKSYDKINKVGQAIMKARQGDVGDAVDMAGDALAYILEKTGVTTDEETTLYNQLYNGKPPTNLSQTFGALQPFQYYDGAFRISENKDIFGKHWNWQYSGRSPIDIAEEVMVHPYWEFDLDFGIWRMKKPLDDAYPFMLYPKQFVSELKNKDFDMTKMWWWRGSWVKSSADIIEAARKADEQDADAVKYYANTLFGQQKPRVLEMVRRINSVVEREYAALKKSYDLLEQALILQVAIIYAEKTERDPEKYVANWSKMDEAERATYAKIEKMKPVDEKVVPRVDYYSDIRGRVKDRADKPKGEDEFEPIKSRDDWSKLWRRGYELYKKTVDEEGAAGIARLRAQLTAETSAEVAPKVAAKLRAEQDAAEEKAIEESDDSESLKALKRELRTLQKIAVKDLTAEQKARKVKLMEDIAKLENPDDDEPQPVSEAAPVAAPAPASSVPPAPIKTLPIEPVVSEQQAVGGGLLQDVKDKFNEHKEKLAIAAAAVAAAALAAKAYSSYKEGVKKEDENKGFIERNEARTKRMQEERRLEQEYKTKMQEVERAKAAAKKLEQDTAKVIADARAQEKAAREKKVKEMQEHAKANREAMDKLIKLKADQQKIYEAEVLRRDTLRKMEEQNKKNEEAAKKLKGGWSTQNIETLKNEESEIKEQQQYHAILNKEIAKSDAKLKNLVKRNVVGKGKMNGKGQNFASIDFKEGAAGKDPDISKAEIENILEQQYDKFYKKDYADMSKDEIAKIHDDLWRDQQLSNDFVKLNWSNYDFLLKRYKIPRDIGIEKFRKDQNKDGVYRSARGYKFPKSSAAQRDEAARWTTEQIVNDKVSEKLDVLEDKKDEIAKRLLSATEQKTRDDLEKLKTDLQKQIDDLKKPSGGRVGRPSKMRKVGGEKEAGDPLKKLSAESKYGFETGIEKIGDKLSKGKDIVDKKIGQIGKAVELANKAKGVYNKVDKFLDNIKPIDPNLPALEIAKEETRKDTDFQNKVLSLLDNYDELDAAEAEAEYEKLVKEYQAQLKKISEREARQKRIKESGYGKSKPKDEENVMFEIQEIPSTSKLMRHIKTKVKGGNEPAEEAKKEEEKKPDSNKKIDDGLKNIEKVIDVADKLASQLEKFDGSKYKEDRTSDKVARTPTAPTKHNRGSAKPMSEWMAHVKAYKANHPNLKYGEVLKQAKLSYMPLKGTGLPDRSISGGGAQLLGAAVSIAPSDGMGKKSSAWSDHVKATKAAHPGKLLKEVLKLASASYKK